MKAFSTFNINPLIKCFRHELNSIVHDIAEFDAPNHKHFAEVIQHFMLVFDSC